MIEAMTYQDALRHIDGIPLSELDRMRRDLHRRFLQFRQTAGPLLDALARFSFINSRPSYLIREGELEKISDNYSPEALSLIGQMEARIDEIQRFIFSDPWPRSW